MPCCGVRACKDVMSFLDFAGLRGEAGASQHLGSLACISTSHVKTATCVANAFPVFVSSSNVLLNKFYALKRPDMISLHYVKVPRPAHHISFFFQAARWSSLYTVAVLPLAGDCHALLLMQCCTFLVLLILWKLLISEKLCILEGATQMQWHLRTWQAGDMEFCCPACRLRLHVGTQQTAKTVNRVG
jgi:hypothetical protein